MKLKINDKEDTVNIGCGCGTFFFLAFVLIILTVGNPDLLDALISLIQGAGK
jgi:hypothetical protein